MVLTDKEKIKLCDQFLEEIEKIDIPLYDLDEDMAQCDFDDEFDPWDAKIHIDDIENILNKLKERAWHLRIDITD